VLLEGLRPGRHYWLKVRGATRSIYDSNLIYAGPFGAGQGIKLGSGPRGCDDRTRVQQAFSSVAGAGSESSLGSLGGAANIDVGAAGAVAGIVLASFALVLALLALTVWR